MLAGYIQGGYVVREPDRFISVVESDPFAMGCGTIDRQKGRVFRFPFPNQQRGFNVSGKMNVLPRHRLQSVAHNELNRRGRGSMVEPGRRYLGFLGNALWCGMAIQRANSISVDLKTLLVGLGQHAFKIASIQLGKFRLLGLKRLDQVIEVNPALIVELKFKEPRVMPQGERCQFAQVFQAFFHERTYRTEGVAEQEPAHLVFAGQGRGDQ